MYIGLAACLWILEYREREVARDYIIDNMISYIYGEINSDRDGRR
jgi:hypothetical protein